MNLKERLKLIISKVPPSDCVCDIGTDHAYIPINLILNKVCKKVIATDVKEGPVLVARKNIEKYGLLEYIDTRVGDGLSAIEEDEADVIIIAGMGGILIKNILAEGFNKAKKAKRLILQPMSYSEVLREWLLKSGFEIIDEELTLEGRKVYNVMVAAWDGKERNDEDVYYYIGRRLVENNDPLLIRLAEIKLRHVNRVINGLKNQTVQNEEEIKYHKRLADDIRKIIDSNSGKLP